MAECTWDFGLGHGIRVGHPRSNPDRRGRAVPIPDTAPPSWSSGGRRVWPESTDAELDGPDTISVGAKYRSPATSPRTHGRAGRPSPTTDLETTIGLHDKVAELRQERDHLQQQLDDLRAELPATATTPASIASEVRRTARDADRIRVERGQLQD